MSLLSSVLYCFRFHFAFCQSHPLDFQIEAVDLSAALERLQLRGLRLDLIQKTERWSAPGNWEILNPQELQDAIARL